MSQETKYKLLIDVRPGDTLYITDCLSAMKKLTVIIIQDCKTIDPYSKMEATYTRFVLSNGNEIHITKDSEVARTSKVGMRYCSSFRLPNKARAYTSKEEAEAAVVYHFEKEEKHLNQKIENLQEQLNKVRKFKEHCLSI